MIAAAAIAMGTKGVPAPELGKVPGASHGAGPTGFAPRCSLPAVAAQPESFRSGWKSFLATLNSGANGFTNAEPAEDEGVGFAQAGQKETAAGSSAATASLAAGPGLRLMQWTQKQSGVSHAGRQSSPAAIRGAGEGNWLNAGARSAASTGAEDEGVGFAQAGQKEAAAGSSAATASLAAGPGLRLMQWTQKQSGVSHAGRQSSPAAIRGAEEGNRLNAGTRSAASTGAEEKKPATESKPRSSSSSRPDYSIKACHAEGAAAATMPGLILMTMTSPEQAAQASRIATSDVGSSSGRTRSSQAEATRANGLLAVPAGFASSQVDSPPLEALTGAIGPAAAAVPETTEGDAMPVIQGHGSPGPGLNWPSTPAHNTAALPSLAGDPPPQAVRYQGPRLLEVPAAGRDLAHTVVPGQSPIEAPLPGWNLNQPQESSQILAATAASSENPIHTVLPSNDRIQIPLSGPKPAQSVVRAQGTASTRESVRISAQLPVPNQSPSPASVAVPARIQTLALNQYPVRTYEPTQNPPLAALSGEKTIEPAVPGLNLTEMPAPGPSPSPMAVGSRDLTQPQMPGPHFTQTAMPEQSTTAPLAPDLKPAQYLASGWESFQPFVPSQSGILPQALNQAPIRTASPVQELAFEGMDGQNQVEAPASSQMLAETLSPNDKPSSAFPGIENRTRPQMTVPNLSHAARQEQIATPRLQPDPVPAQGLLPGQNPSRTTVPAQDGTRSAQMSQNPARTSEPERGPAQAVALGQNRMGPPAPGRQPIQAFMPVLQNTTQTGAKIQDPIPASAQLPGELPMHPANLGAHAVPAPAGGDDPDRAPVLANAASQSGQPSAAPLIVSKPDAVGGGRFSVPTILQSVAGAGRLHSSKPAGLRAEGQPSGAVVDLSVLPRDLISVPGAMRTPSGSEHTAAAAAIEPDPRETFAALDAGAAQVKPTWVHAGVQHAEAGFQDPSLGWVAVRADASGGGGVHAELVPSSGAAAQALGTHLAGLNAYLAEHHTPVETLTLAAPEGGGARADSAGQGMQQGPGEQTGQQAGSGSQSGPDASPAALPAAASELTVLRAELDGNAPEARSQGMHISVMA